MGVGIVEVVVSYGYQVLLYDIFVEVLICVIDGIYVWLNLCVMWGKLIVEICECILKCLILVIDIYVLVVVDLVIEVVFECLEVKKVFFV